MSIGNKPLCPEQTVVEYLYSGAHYKATYSFTQANGDYMYDVRVRVLNEWKFVNRIKGYMLKELIESGVYDEVIEAEGKEND